MSASRSGLPTAAASLLLAFAAGAQGPQAAAPFATPGGPEPANVTEVTELLRKDGYDLELLISFGTSRGGSAGHLALAVRGEAPDDEWVYSANFHADRAPEHAKSYYTDELMARIPKQEYLFGTSSSLGPKASFGLDFGEVYKRSLIGVRVSGVPAAQKQALVAFFARINTDFHRRVERTEYHDREVKYDYLHLNCAKTIGAAFRYGAGYAELEVKGAKVLPARTTLVAAAHANIPADMAMKLMKAWGARGYAMDVVLYRKYDGSGYIDPLEEKPVAFRDLPNRFPSVLSLDFRNDDGYYEDYDNLFLMHLVRNMGRYRVSVDGTAQRLVLDAAVDPKPYREAAGLAATEAGVDSKRFLRRLPARPGRSADHMDLYDFAKPRKSAP